MNTHITNLSFFKQNSFGDTVLYRELLSIFVKTTPEMVGQMQAALQNNNYDQLSKIAHKLKSNVQSVGLQHVYNVLEDIESNKFSGTADVRLKATLQTIEQECHNAVLEIKAELDRVS